MHGLNMHGTKWVFKMCDGFLKSMVSNMQLWPQQGLQAFFGGVSLREGQALKLCLLETSLKVFVVMGQRMDKCH